MNKSSLSPFSCPLFLGTLIGEGILTGIEARVIFIVKDGKVTYKQVVPEITQAPDYTSVLEAI